MPPRLLLEWHASAGPCGSPVTWPMVSPMPMNGGSCIATSSLPISSSPMTGGQCCSISISRTVTSSEDVRIYSWAALCPICRRNSWSRSIAATGWDSLPTCSVWVRCCSKCSPAIGRLWCRGSRTWAGRLSKCWPAVGRARLGCVPAMRSSRLRWQRSYRNVLLPNRLSVTRRRPNWPTISRPSWTTDRWSTPRTRPYGNGWPSGAAVIRGLLRAVP